MASDFVIVLIGTNVFMEICGCGRFGAHQGLCLAALAPPGGGATVGVVL